MAYEVARRPLIATAAQTSFGMCSPVANLAETFAVCETRTFDRLPGPDCRIRWM